MAQVIECEITRQLGRIQSRLEMSSNEVLRMTLPAFGLAKMELDYKTSKKTDAFGNRFRYRAKVKDTQDASFGRSAWDVFLVSAP